MTPSFRPSPSAPTVRAVTPLGLFDVPTSPQRVVILDGRHDLETSIALGLPKPVAVGAHALGADGNLAGYAPFRISGIEVLDGRPTVENIEALQPDLILGPLDPAFEQVKQLAPVIAVDTHGADWKACLTSAGRWTGRSELAAEALAAYQERVNEFRVRHFDRLAGVAAEVVVAGADRTWSRCESDRHCLALRTLHDLGGRRSSTPLTSDVLMVIAGAAHSHTDSGSGVEHRNLATSAHRNIVFTSSRGNAGSVYSAIQCVDLWDQVYSML